MAKVVKRKAKKEEKKKIVYVKCSGPKDAFLKSLDRRDNPENQGNPHFRFITTHMKKWKGHYSCEIIDLSDGVFHLKVRLSSDPFVNGLTHKGSPLNFDQVEIMDKMKSDVRLAVLEHFTNPDTPHIKPKCIAKRHLVKLDTTRVDVPHPQFKHQVLGYVEWAYIEFKVTFNCTWPAASLFDMSLKEEVDYGTE